MDQGPGELAESEMSLRPFWSFVEILGIVAVIVPFVITVSSSSMSTVNGRVTQFVFRDWVAVGGGIAGALCGLGAAARFRTTMKSQRALRAAVVLGLLGLGTFQILRGFGITQPHPDAGPDRVDPMDDPIIRESIANAEKHRPVADPTKPPIDLVAPVQAIVGMWQGRQYDELYSHLTPAFQHDTSKEDLAMLFTRVDAAVGKCAPPTGVTYALDGETWVATGTMACDQAKVIVKLGFQIHDGTALFQNYNVEPATPPTLDVGEATKLVRGLLDDLLAAKLDHLGAAVDARVIKNMGDPAAFQASLAKVVAGAGKLGAIREVSSTGEGDPEHSFVYDVVGAKHHLTATFTAHFMLARWFVTDFNLAPAEPKK